VGTSVGKNQLDVSLGARHLLRDVLGLG